MRPPQRGKRNGAIRMQKKAPGGKGCGPYHRVVLRAGVNPVDVRRAEWISRVALSYSAMTPKV